MTKETPYRSPNFTPKEVETLIYHLELNPELIKPAARPNRDGVVRSGVLLIRDKIKLWEEVAFAINKAGESNVTGIVRTGTDVKNKWNDMKSRIKTKAEDIRKGKLSDKTPLSHLEERVLYLLSKTSYLQGLNGALPPAFLNVIGHRKQDKTSNSNSEPIQNENPDEPNSEIEKNTVEREVPDVIIKKEVTQKLPRKLAPTPIMPAVTGIPIITFTAPFSQIIQTPTEANVNNNLGVQSNSKKNSEIANENSKDNDAQEIIEMIYLSQKELKNEIKTIKKIMIRMHEQKRKRIEQENEKIQLKKMKLMLKCRKQGVDYDEFITDFL